jgi:DUF1365 family protein
MMYLDLSELDSLFRKRWFWSSRFPAPAWFRRKEHLGDPDEPLDQSVRQLIGQKTGKNHEGPIRLLTHLRYFGFQMNPVSFFFCFDQQERLQHIVAEVNNTPWGEQHCYVLSPEHFCSEYASRQPHDKAFHVSPFLPMDMQYRWRVSVPDQRLNIAIANYQDDKRVLNVAMTMQRHVISSKSLRQVLVRFPAMTMQVFVAIYWQAFRLWRKKVGFFTHPDKVSSEPAQSTSGSSPEEHMPSNDTSSETLSRNV